VFSYPSDFSILFLSCIADVIVLVRAGFSQLSVYLSSFIVRRTIILLRIVRLPNRKPALIYLRFSGFITFDEAGKMRLRIRRSSPQSTFSYPIISPTEISSPSLKPRESEGFPWSKVTRSNYAASDHDGHIGGLGSESFSPSPNTQLKRVARRIMWYPVCECGIISCMAIHTLISALVYAIVVIPVAVCRMGALAGWTPPFDLLVFAGICFGSSGEDSKML
jgi:hypothetical protein